MQGTKPSDDNAYMYITQDVRYRIDGVVKTQREMGR
jgi:hypothetical protein